MYKRSHVPHNAFLQITLRFVKRRNQQKVEAAFMLMNAAKTLIEF